MDFFDVVHVDYKGFVNNSEKQNWKRSKDTKDGFFMIESSFLKGKYLTYKHGNGNTVVTGIKYVFNYYAFFVL